MASSIFIQTVGFTIILLYLLIRYKYPKILISSVDIDDDVGIECPNGDIDCYDKCVDGTCSDPKIKNIWLNVVVIFITLLTRF